MPRIASDTSPCVGGARFHSVPCWCWSVSGAGRRARWVCRSRHPQRGHPLRETLGQRPAIKAVETVAGQHAQGTGEGGLAKAAAGPRGLARDQPGFAEARLMAQLFQFAGGGVGLRGSDRNAVFGIADRIGQQAGHRQRAAG
jgi:hypothetical protein